LVCPVKVITANKLSLGEVVYWTKSRGWQPSLQQAQVLEDADAEGALELAAESVKRCEVVAPYAFPVRVEQGRIIALSAREQIRARGPSVRLDVGKQAA
jgi:hypothetical protein